MHRTYQMLQRVKHRQPRLCGNTACQQPAYNALSWGRGDWQDGWARLCAIYTLLHYRHTWIYRLPYSPAYWHTGINELEKLTLMMFTAHLLVLNLRGWCEEDEDCSLQLDISRLSKELWEHCHLTSELFTFNTIWHQSTLHYHVTLELFTIPSDIRAFKQCPKSKFIIVSEYFTTTKVFKIRANLRLDDNCNCVWFAGFSRRMCYAEVLLMSCRKMVRSQAGSRRSCSSH